MTTAASYASGTSDEPLLGETIGQVLDRVAAAQPAAPALVEVGTGRRWTYAELRAAADEVALGLLAAGVRRGDRVGIWAPNLAEWTLVQFGSAKIGAILVTINPAYRSHELAHVLGLAHVDSKAELMYPEGQQDLHGYQQGDRSGLTRLGQGDCVELL